MDTQTLCLSPVWPVPGIREERRLPAIDVMEMIAGEVSEELEMLEYRHEIIFIYCGYSKDGRPMVASQISSQDMEVCLIEDVNGECWVVCGRPGSERQSIRLIAADDRPLDIASACVRAFGISRR